MRRLKPAWPILLALSLCAFVNATGDVPSLPSHLLQLDFDRPPRDRKNPEVSRHTYLPRGGILQISVIRSAEKKEETLQTLKVEIAGESVISLAIVEVPVRWIMKGDEVVDSKRRNLTVFLEGVKGGRAKVKITPVGADGKDQPSQEFLVQVGPEKQAQQNTAVPGALTPVDFNGPAEKSKVIALAKSGDMAEIFVPVEKKGGSTIRNLKVEINGDSIRVLPTLELDIRFGPRPSKDKQGGDRDPSGYLGMSTGKHNLSAFLVARHNGATTVKITPVSDDSKEWPSREWVIQVGQPPAKKGDAPTK